MFAVWTGGAGPGRHGQLRVGNRGGVEKPRGQNADYQHILFYCPSLYCPSKIECILQTEGKATFNLMGTIFIAAQMISYIFFIEES